MKWYHTEPDSHWDLWVLGWAYLSEGLSIVLSFARRDNHAVIEKLRQQLDREKERERSELHKASNGK